MEVIIKANPTQGDLHINQALTNLSIAYIQSDDSFVASRVFPIVPVQHQTDVYWKFDRGDFIRNQAQKRADSTESVGGGWKVATDSYRCDVYAIHKDIGAQVRANADAAVSPELQANSFVSQQLMIRKEVDWAARYFTTGVWTTDMTGVTTTPTGNQVYKWSDYTNSDPITDISTGATAMQLRTGKRPNKLVIGQQVWDVLKNHPDIIDRIKYGQTTGTAIAKRQTFAELFEVDTIEVMSAIVNTKNETKTFDSFTNAFIGGKKALLTYTTNAPALLEPSAGYTFAWTGYQNNTGVQISSWWEQNIKSTRVEGEMTYDMKVTAPDLGYFFDQIVA